MRGNEILFRGNELRFRGNEICIRGTLESQLPPYTPLYTVQATVLGYDVPGKRSGIDILHA